MTAGLARRLIAALALLLLAFGVFVALLVRDVGHQQEQQSLQRVSRGLAEHIVGHWPEVHSRDPADSGPRTAILQMLMTVNPAIQVYLLDADGRVVHYLGEPGMVRTPAVDLAPVRAFLRGATLPLLGTDPMGGTPRVFSAAMFPPRPGDSRPPGYLYVMLQSGSVLHAADSRPVWLGAAWALAAGVLATALLGALIVWRLTVPLNRLARRMQTFEIDGTPDAPPRATPDEVRAISRAFATLSERIREQVRGREHQAAAHREVMASVAHDLRTPLTALHGHLEALASQPAEREPGAKLLHAALAQSDKVRRLTQQLFELATLQSTDDLPQRERFRLDELVSDTVQKFDPGLPRPTVALTSPSPEPVTLDGDLHLIERALSNLIDNALRHGQGTEPVRVSLERNGQQVRVLVQDSGAGLPPELARRLDAGQSVREPPPRRPGGGIGGLGLAIAQRIAVLHGGTLSTLPSRGSGTLLALNLPMDHGG